MLESNLKSKLAEESVELRIPKADRPTEERDTVMACRKKKKKTERDGKVETDPNQLSKDTIPEHSIDLFNESHNKNKKKKGKSKQK